MNRNKFEHGKRFAYAMMDMVPHLSESFLRGMAAAIDEVTARKIKAKRARDGK